MRIPLCFVFLSITLILTEQSASAEPDKKRELFQIESAGSKALQLQNLTKKSPVSKVVTLAEALMPRETPRSILTFKKDSLLCVWSGASQAAFGLYHLENGQLIEKRFGAWLAGWYPRGSDDFNGDKLTDFLLVKSTGTGNSRKYFHRAAIQQKDGTFQFTKRPLKPFVQNARGAFFGLADMDQDGRKDLLFHSFSHGASYRATIYMKKGMAKGEFGPARKLVSTSVAATSIVVGDFNSDGLNDLYLPPDDDVSDDGQSYLVFNLGAGRFSKAKDSIDFLPKNEGFGADTFTAFGRAIDFDQDGKLDLLVRKILIGKSSEWSVYHGNGKGGFPKETVIRKVKWGSPTSFFFLQQKETFKKAVRVPDSKMSDQEFKDQWLKLGAKDVKSAAQALRLFMNAGSSSIPAIVRKLTENGPDGKVIESLIAELNEDSLERRNRATKTLASYGDLISKQLFQALKNSPSVETRWRVTVLLKEIEKAQKSQDTEISRRNFRAIRLLESMNSKLSKVALKKLSKDASYGLARENALAALARIGGQ
ncbi:MAG: VCBS repeat-containing protein [Planctomycetota bacterium]|nr:VCBS repeat-containing protein [Planctomycetota bacterium]